MDEPTIETLSSDQRPERIRTPRAGRAVAAGTQATALGAALSLVMVGGLVTAAYRSFNRPADPTTLVPASAFAVAEMDLSAPGDDLATFANHFPGSPTRHGDGSAVDRLLRAAWNSDGGDSNYDREVHSWLGDHVAVAGVLDGHGKPQLEVVLQSRNDAEARKQISKGLHQDDEGGFVIADGYAVLAQSTALARGFVKAAHEKSVASTGHYAADIARLPSGEAAVGWMDGPGVRDAISDALGPEADMLFDQPQFLGLGDTSFEGRLAAGLHVTGDYVELDLAQVGGPDQKTAASSRVTDLPNGTIAALELGDPSAPIQAAAKVLSSVTAGFAVGSTTDRVPSPAVATDCGAVVGVIPPDSAIPPGTPHRRQLLRQLHRARRDTQRQQQDLRSGQCDPQQFEPPQPPDPIETIRAATGLNFPDDVTALLGTGTVVAYGGLQLGGLPDVAVRATPKDLSGAQSLAETLRQHVQDKTGIDIAVKTDGDDLVLATSGAYADQVAGNGGLGEQKLPTLALGDVPAQVSSLGYVDLSRLWPLAGGDFPAGVTHLKALGFWSSVDGSVQRMQLRLVAG